jgi:OOP family OmpA-OmpF porin
MVSAVAGNSIIIEFIGGHMQRIIILLALLMPSLALAEQTTANETKGLYVGVGIGASSYDDDNYFDQLRLDDSEVGIKLFGGYRFSQYFSLEGAVVGLGSFDADSSSSEIKNEFGLMSFSGVGNLPIFYGIALYGQLGFGFASISQDIAYATPSAQLVTRNDNDSALAGLYGAGLKFIPPTFRKLEFTLGWERYVFSTDTTRVDAGIRSQDDVDHEFDFVFVGVALNFW